MRIGIINRTGNPDLDGAFLDWVPGPEGDTFTVEGRGLVLTLAQLTELVERGYATSMDGDTSLLTAIRDSEPRDAVAEPGSQRAAIYAAAAVPAAVRARKKRREQMSANSRWSFLRPYRGLLWTAFLVLLLVAAWQFYRLAPPSWQATFHALLGRYVF